MAQVLVRDLPGEVVERLKAKAAAQGHSLEAYLRRVLEDASRLDREELLMAAEPLAAPDILAAELTNAMWVKLHPSAPLTHGQPDLAHALEDLLARPFPLGEVAGEVAQALRTGAPADLRHEGERLAQVALVGALSSP